MNRKRKARVFTALIALLLTAVFLFSACEVINGPNAVVATVDGTEIYRWEVDYYYERNLSNYTSVGGLDPENNSEEKLMIYKSILETLINDTAMNLYAEELGYGLTDEEKAEIDAEYAATRQKNIETFAEEYDGDLEKGEQAYLDYLADNNVTEEIVVESMYTSAMRQKMSDDIYAGIASTDEEIREVYDELVKSNKESYDDDLAAYEQANAYDVYTVMYHPRDYHRFRSIFIRISEEALTELGDLQLEMMDAQEELATLVEQKGENDSAVQRQQEELEGMMDEFESIRREALDEVRERADEVQALLNAGGDFEELMEEYTDDSEMLTDPYGTYGYFMCEETTDWPDAIKEAVLGMTEVGQTTTEPIEGDYGYYILELTQIIEQGPRDFNDPDIQEFLHSVAELGDTETVYNETVQKALEGREIVRYEDRLD